MIVGYRGYCDIYLDETKPDRCLAAYPGQACWPTCRLCGDQTCPAHTTPGSLDEERGTCTCVVCDPPVRWTWDATLFVLYLAGAGWLAWHSVGCVIWFFDLGCATWLLILAQRAIERFKAAKKGRG